MVEHITKDAVISLFEKWSDGYAYIEIPVQDAIRQVSSIPPADVKPVVHDRWERVEFDDGHGPYYLFEHKKCGCVMAKKRNYCPDCGAEMDGEP